MGTDQAKLTVRQERLVKALASGKADSVTQAAEMAGLARSTASLLVNQNPTVIDALSKARARQEDNARALADKALRRSHRALDAEEDDPLRMVQAAAGAMTVAKLHNEGFAPPAGVDDESLDASIARRDARYMVAGGLRVLRLLAAGLPPESIAAELRASLVARGWSKRRPRVEVAPTTGEVDEG